MPVRRIDGRGSNRPCGPRFFERLGFSVRGDAVRAIGPLRRQQTGRTQQQRLGGRGFEPTESLEWDALHEAGEWRPIARVSERVGERLVQALFRAQRRVSVLEALDSFKETNLTQFSKTCVYIWR